MALWHNRPRERELENKSTPIKSDSGGLQHGPFISPKLKRKSWQGRGTEDSCLLILHFNICKGEKCWKSQNTQKHVGTMSDGIKDKHVFKNNITFNRKQLGWGSAVNSGLADSCCYLEPDVLILGLGQGRGIRRNVMMDWKRLRAIWIWNLESSVNLTRLEWWACHSEHTEESDQ